MSQILNAGDINSKPAVGLETENQRKKSVVMSKPLLRLKLLNVLRHETDFNKLVTLIKEQHYHEKQGGEGEEEFRGTNSEPASPLSDSVSANVSEVLHLLLHYAVQVSPLQIIKAIVENFILDENNNLLKLDINYQDTDGNTALHLAAYQSRADVVQYLMAQTPYINDCVVNNRHLQPIEMCKDLNVATMMQLQRSKYITEIATEFRLAFNNRDFGHLETILEIPRNFELLDINGTDPTTGDTVLHEFVKKKDIVMVRWILNHNGDPFKRDKNGKLPIDLINYNKMSTNQDSSSRANSPHGGEHTDKVSDSDIPRSAATNLALNQELKKVLQQAARDQSVIDITNNLHEAPTFKGYLRKWTNFAQGYKLRWFVLNSNGTLAYYKDQDDTMNACRGSLNMHNCYLHLDSSEKLKFEIVGGSDGSIRWHLKGNHPVETNRWVWAIQGAIRYAKDRDLALKQIPANSNNNTNNNNNNNTHTTNNGNGPAFSPLANTLQPHQQNAFGLDSTSTFSNASNLSGTPHSSKSSHVGDDHKTHKRNNTETSIKSDINENLTEDGKLFVERIKSHDGSIHKDLSSDENDKKSIFSMESNNNVLLPPQIQLSNKLHNILPKADHSMISMNSSDEEHDHDEEEDDEDEDIEGKVLEEIFYSDKDKNNNKLATNVGPYASKLSMLERSIAIELSSLNDLFSVGGFGNDDLVLEAAQKSLQTMETSFKQLSSIQLKRTKKLIKLLIKQKDMNNLWIKSVKDLELELMQKEDKLSALSSEKRKLVKLLQQNKNDAHGNEKMKQEIIEWQKQSVDDSEEEDDEFFDAEETQSVIDSEQPVEHAEVVSAEKEGITSNSVPTISVSPIEKDVLKVDQSKPIVDTLSSKQTVVSVDENVPAGLNELQAKKYKLLAEEGTFKGYEDGLRKRLGLSKDDRPSVSLWSVLKSMVGKDMTKMTLPVSFNEPTSLLQRVAEDMEYEPLLEKAASMSNDSTLRLLYVSIFAASAYASTQKRVAKPFNPLLGETYEYCRPDQGYRFFTEQVSHHPPVSAIWCESSKYDYYGESNVDSKFNGRSFDFKHLGDWYLKLRPDGDKLLEETYTFRKPNNQVVGILLGNPQIDIYGDMEIVNHTTGDKCLLHFKARGWRSNHAFELKGEVYNAKGGKEWVLGGHWNEDLYAKKVLKPNSPEEMKVDGAEVGSSAAAAASAAYNDSEAKYDGSKFLIWKAAQRPDSPFNLTNFAITLNAPQPNLIKYLPPTDTRLRPDQRAMEDGQYDKAATEKHRVEEKQRAARKERDASNIKYKPKWFTKKIHPITKTSYWESNGEYWKKRNNHEFSDCPSIF